ncbi:MAG TPA: sigma-70 family RNA polymerase sigma factor [Polyangia bacterium]|nr:sigma-70 family RNA polymerase sigma factor [Polyangia bacterium]
MPVPHRSPATSHQLAFEALYRAEWQRVRRRLRALGTSPRDLDDLCHEVFIVAHERLPEANMNGRPQLWLAQVCRYVAFAHRRRAAYRLEVPCGDLEDQTPAPQAANDDEAGSGHELEALHVALSAMNPRDRDLLALHEVGDLSFRALGDLCGCDPKTAKKRFLSAERRAQALLRDGAARAFGAPDNDVGELAWAAGTLDGEGVLLEETPTLRIGTYGAVMITSWCGPFTARELDVVRACMKGLATRVGARVGHLAFIEPGCPKPGFGDRNIIVEMLRSARTFIAFEAFVGTPRNGLIAQAVLLAMGALARTAFPIRVFPGAAPAAAWLKSSWDKTRGLPWDRDGLLAAAEAVRPLAATTN